MSDEEREREPERVAPEEESSFARGLRYGHRAVLYAAILVGMAVFIFLIFLIARNADSVRFDYVFGETHTRLIWLIVISAIAGWVLGVVTSYLVGRRTRGPR